MTSATILSTITKEVEKEPWKTASEATTCCCGYHDAIQCEETRRPWNGFSGDEILERLGIQLDAQGRDSSGHKVIVQQQRTHDGPCGYLITRMGSCHNCCSGEHAPPELLWYGDESADVVAPSSWAKVEVLGGRGPFNWSVRGTGFYTDNFNGGLYKDAETDGPELWIWANSEACGTATITCEDVCKQKASGKLRCTEGQLGPINNDRCATSGMLEGWNPDNTAGWVGAIYVGQSAHVPYCSYSEEYLVEYFCVLYPVDFNCNPLSKCVVPTGKPLPCGCDWFYGYVELKSNFCIYTWGSDPHDYFWQEWVC